MWSRRRLAWKGGKVWYVGVRVIFALAFAVFGTPACGLRDPVTVDDTPLDPRVVLIGGVSPDDDVRGLDVDASGNVGVTGFYTASMSISNERFMGFNDQRYLAYIESSGDARWLNNLSGSEEPSRHFQSNDVSFAPDGSLLVGFDVLEGGLSFDDELLDFDLAMVMASFGRNGELAWISFGSPGEEGGGTITHLSSVTMFPSGKFNAVGTFGERITIGPYDLVSDASDRDSFIVRISPVEGEGVLWLQAIGRTPEQGSSVRETIARAIADGWQETSYVAGHYEGEIVIADRWLGSDDVDAFLVKLDHRGSELWVAPIWGEGPQEAVAVTTGTIAESALSRREVAYVGVSSIGSTGVHYHSGSAKGRGAVIQVSGPTGIVDWAVGFDGTIHDLASSPEGDVLVAGTFRASVDFGGVRLTSPSTFDTGFIMKYSSGGHPLWAEMIPGRGPVRCREVEVTPLGEVVVAGTFDTAATFGAVEKVGFGGQDVFLLRLGPDGSW